MSYLIRCAIYCACVLFAINVLFVAWLVVLGWFRARCFREIEARKSYLSTSRPIPYGTYAAILEKLNRRR